jgi:hypothetical protein
LGFVPQTPLASFLALVQEGKSKKAKVKRKNADFVGCLAILNGWLISAAMY